MACFMGLVSYFASLPEVLWVGPYHRHKVLNAVARAVSQSATITDTPLTDAGLDGTDEVIQVWMGGILEASKTRFRRVPSMCRRIALWVLPGLLAQHHSIHWFVLWCWTLPNEMVAAGSLQGHGGGAMGVESSWRSIRIFSCMLGRRGVRGPRPVLRPWNFSGTFVVLRFRIGFRDPGTMTHSSA